MKSQWSDIVRNGEYESMDEFLRYLSCYFTFYIGYSDNMYGKIPESIVYKFCFAMCDDYYNEKYIIKSKNFKNKIKNGHNTYKEPLIQFKFGPSMFFTENDFHMFQDINNQGEINDKMILDVAFEAQYSLFYKYFTQYFNQTSLQQQQQQQQCQSSQGTENDECSVQDTTETGNLKSVFTPEIVTDMHISLCRFTAWTISDVNVPESLFDKQENSNHVCIEIMHFYVYFFWHSFFTTHSQKIQKKKQHNQQKQLK